MSDTLTASDTLVVVNRKASAFGAGWWLAGYERLVRLGDGSFLWVGGDGSTRRYVRDTARAGEAYGAAAFERPDSLVLDGGVYVRQLRHRARVEFDATGRHVATRDPLGIATTFEHDPTSGRLIAVLHPAASEPRHRFFYSGGATPLLDSVTGPAPNPAAGPPTRKVALTHAQRGKVTRITDADGRFVAFGYQNANSVVILSRTNRNGVAQSFAFASNRLVQATVPLNASESAVSAFCPAEVRGLASGGCGAAPLSPADAVTTVDGPRPASDVNDVTTIKTDRFGAPLVVTDPVGNSTRLFRGDRAFPGGPYTFLGTLVENGAGSTGMLYRRNRVYDPETGRFTQQDPLGLGGGKNLYGFADGDPVNVSDPFGLCPPADSNPYDCPGLSGALVILGMSSPGIQREIATFAPEALVQATMGGGTAFATTRALASLTRISAKLQNLFYKLNQRTLMGAARDVRGFDSKGQHLKKTSEAAAGLRREILNLRGVIGSPGATQAERDAAVHMLREASRRLDEANEVIRTGYYPRVRNP